MSRHDPPLILVADDQLPTTLMLERVFQMEGYQVRSVYDGIAALEAVHQDLPDLLLLDVNMPKMNGFEVLKALRENDETVNIPTILITAMGELSDVVHGLTLGADDYIRKPFHPQELLARAQSKMRARELEESLQRRTQELEVLLRVSEELSQHFDSPELLDFVLYLMTDLVPCRSIALYHVKDNEVINQSTRIKDEFPSKEFLKDPDILKSVLHERQITVLTEPDFSSADTQILVVPIIYSDQIKGIALIETLSTEYDENHLRVLAGISRQAALALHNAELYEIQANYALHLEDMVQARTKELESANQMLIRSEKLASIGRLAASIAHEIKNPLMPIRLNLEGMVEDIEDGRPVDLQDVMRSLKSAERIQQIVDNVLGFTGKGHSQATEFQTLELNNILTDIVELNRKSLMHNNININLNLERIPKIRGNRYQIEQVFMNLVLNAKDAMKQDGILTLSTKKERDQVQITIEDTGSGIKPEVLEQLFEPFVTTKDDGNGLGLFISHGIIQTHQGKIQVESTLGKGTRFLIWLPSV